MKLALCRHRIDKYHELFGFGYILEDHGHKVRVRWIDPKSVWNEHVIVRKSLIFLD